MIELSEAVKDGIAQVAKLMALSALTAPKGRGVDNVLVKILDKKEELETLAAAMDELAREYGEFFARDAHGVRRSEVVLLVGCRIVDFKLRQPKEVAVDVNLAMSLVNLGIALGSAVKTASLHNVDNRIMYTIGIAAKKLNLLDADVVIGVPLSATSKNMYFDRVWPPK